MTREELKIKLLDLYSIKHEFQKMNHTANLSYVNNVSTLLKETNIDSFIKNSESINKLYQTLDLEIKSALTDIDVEIKLIESKLEK